MPTTPLPPARPPGTRLVIALVVLAVDLFALAGAGVLAGWTWLEFRSDPEADPLTALGYVLGAILAAPALVSLPFLALARGWWGTRAGDVLLGLAATPATLLVLMAATALA